MESGIPVVSYARISADNRGDEHGVRDQHKVNRETAARLGWTVVAEFTDNDKSAAKADVYRDDFEAMLKVLKAGKLPDGRPVQGVVIVAEDRLARRPGDYERFVEAITYKDGRVYADARGSKDLYSEDTESMGLFGAVISKMEVRKMQRRMRRSHQARAEQGKPVGGPRPFGWLPDRLTLHPEEAPLLRKAALDFAGGRSLDSIVKEWRRHGVLTSRGNPWIRMTLRSALANPRLCGWRAIGGELVRDAKGEPIVGQWEPILTPEEWQAVMAVMNARKGHWVNRDGSVGSPIPTDQREHRYLLSGILRCGKPKPEGGICNKPLRCRPGKSGVGPHVYLCPGKSDGGCGGISRRGDKIDEFISEALLASLEEKELRRRKERPAAWAGEKELNAAKKRLDELSAQWDEDKISNELFFKLAPQLEKKIARLRAERDKHQASIERARVRAALDVEDLRRRWYIPEEEGGLPISTKRAYLREAFHAIIVRPAVRGRRDFDPDLLEPIWRED
ncbi:recombinase family protein [Thermoactinospora rubra]|uniref:recombinase family protein n=1 Tax=Thermoactinospora rubra TaxID=1088767 RepID=UPI000A117623|nr:recombinase family protein [Thermoactinospora rubra]